MGVKRSYFVRAFWDADAHVFCSESDIKGLHIEAETLEEFEHLVHELAPDLIVENHIQRDDLAKTPLRDLIPSIVLRTPAMANSA